jgi:hypothetical protein
MANLSSENQIDRNRSALMTSAKILFLLAVAVVIILLARNCSSNKTQLENTRASMIRERDSLMNEMKKIHDNFLAVQSEREQLSKSLEKETEANTKLQADKAAGLWQLGKSNKKLTEQKERINSLSGKNDSLLAAITDLEAKMADINRKLGDCDKTTNDQKLNISMLNDTIGKRNEEIGRINKEMAEQFRLDSLKIIPQFVWGLEALGGYGLNVTGVPYSHYFAGPNILAGMEFNHRFLAGIGTGAHFFNGGTLVPIFLEFRYGFEEKNFTPYIYSRGGPLLHFGSYAKSNLFLNAGIGLRHQVSQNIAYNLGIGIYSHNSGVGGRDSFITADFGLLFSKKDKTVPK